MTALGPCTIRVEDAWGPQVAPTCLYGFDFTLLFEETILTVLPLGIAAIWSLLRIVRLREANAKLLPLSPLHIAKLLAYLVYITLHLALLGLWASHKAPTTRATVATSVVTCIVFVVFAYLSHLEHLCSVRPSTLLNVCLAILQLLDIARVRTLWYLVDSRTVAALFLAAFVVKLIVLLLEVTQKRPLLKPRYSSTSREGVSGIFNRALFLWINPLFLRGFRTILSVKTLFDIDEDLLTSSEYQIIAKRWAAASKKSKYSLLWTSIRHFKWDLLAAVPAKLAWIGLTFAQPFLVERVLDFTNEPENINSKNIAYGLIGAYAIVYIGLAVTYAFYEHKTDRLIIKLRGALIPLVFNKTLRVNSASVSDGSALTLMSADIDRIGNGTRQFHEIWSAVIEAPIAIWLLERLLGVAVVGPALFVALLLILGIPLANAAGNFQNDWLEAIEARLAVTSKALGVMKGIKMIGAADAVAGIVTELREDEIRASGRYRLFTTFVLTISYASDAFAPAIGFGTFIVLAESRGTATLTSGVAFGALTLFSLLSGPMMTLVDGAEELKTVINCFERIQDYLELDERHDYRQVIGSATLASDSSRSGSMQDGAGMGESSTELVQLEEKFTSSIGARLVAQIRATSVAWTEEQEPIFENLNVDIMKDKVTMLVGPVGCGKSTLLRLIIGEVPCVSGSVATSFRDSAYCSQSPWIRFGTIQQNILGQSVWDQPRYSEVTSACNLRQDFEDLPEGDQTKVGARGSRLSGGQQTRVAFARALYSTHAVLVLDDVLTGLDRRTEQDILEAVFGRAGILKTSNRTVILATNSAHHLSYADHIIVLGEKGKVDDQGSFAQLSRSNEYVKRLASQPQARTVPKAPEFQPTEEALEDLDLPDEDDVADEARRTGDLKVYKYYFQTAGWWVIGLYMLTACAFTFGTTFPTIWLQWWSDSNDAHGTQRVGYWLGVYAGLGAIAMLGTFTSSFVLLMMMVPVTARRFHRSLLQTTVKATTSFLTSTDVGNTTNRFSSDLELIDLDLPQVFETTILCALGAIAEGVLVFVGSGYVAIAVPGVLVVVYFVQNFYLRTSRQLRFLDIEAKAPLFSHFLEVLAGLTSVRAYGWGAQYSQHNREVLNDSQKPYYLLFTVQRWLTLVLNLLVAGIAILLVGIVTTQRASATSLLGVALFNVVSFGGTLEQLVTDWTQLEQSIGAVARIRSYVTAVKTEDLETEDGAVPEDWPKRGNIEFQDVVASYETSEEPVLKGIDISIRAGQKVAICGRTGSGKSTLMSTLLRMLEMDSGSVVVDGVDISTIPRDTVRERLNTLPQEPFFLHGSVRLNLDPLGLVRDGDDAPLMAALKAVTLWPMIEERGGLDAELDEEILSHGQRQLFCLARAMCKPGCILLLDEATSSVDSDTDALMQRLIATHFSTWTVVAIAHKLQSVLDYDRVVLLERGRVVESAAPRELLAREDSAFRRLYESMAQGDGAGAGED